MMKKRELPKSNPVPVFSEHKKTTKRRSHTPNERILRKKTLLGIYIAIGLIFSVLLARNLLLQAHVFSSMVGSITQNESSNGKMVAPKINNPNLSIIKSDLEEKNFSVKATEILSDPSLVQVTLSNGTTVIFSVEKDIVWQVATLSQLLTRLSIENKTPKKVDFRYQKPIVNF